MLPALVIGNGESRANFNLANLKNQYTLIGCNAIHRDIPVDHLICVDQRMVREAVVHFINPIYTRHRWLKEFKRFPNVLGVPDLPYNGTDRADDPWHWGSGGFALALAVALGHKEITIVGFDLSDKSITVNNIYKDTEHYASSTSSPVDPAYWIYQTAKIFESCPTINFTIIRDVLPLEWQLPNVHSRANI